MNTEHDEGLVIAEKMAAALEQLQSTPHIFLGDLVYYVKERKGRGWNGPAVTRWSDAVELARDSLKEWQNYRRRQE
jgi:hypothetical protein